MERKTKTFVYKGLGFPIELIDAPMKKIIGEWVLDVDMNVLQKFVFKGLIHKPYSLRGPEVRFMRKYLELSTTEVAQKLGISHATIVNWETEKSNISPMQESYLRLFFLEKSSESELASLYREIRPEGLASDERSQSLLRKPFCIDVKLMQKSVKSFKGVHA